MDADERFLLSSTNLYFNKYTKCIHKESIPIWGDLKVMRSGDFVTKVGRRKCLGSSISYEEEFIP